MCSVNPLAGIDLKGGLEDMQEMAGDLTAGLKDMAGAAGEKVGELADATSAKVGAWAKDMQDAVGTKVSGRPEAFAQLNDGARAQ